MPPEALQISAGPCALAGGDLWFYWKRVPNRPRGDTSPLRRMLLAPSFIRFNCVLSDHVYGDRLASVDGTWCRRSCTCRLPAEQGRTDRTTGDYVTLTFSIHRRLTFPGAAGPVEQPRGPSGYPASLRTRTRDRSHCAGFAQVRLSKDRQSAIICPGQWMPGGPAGSWPLVVEPD